MHKRTKSINNKLLLMRILTKLLACLWLFTCNSLIAQTPAIDSMNNLLKYHSKNPAEQLKVMVEICEAYTRLDKQKALQETAKLLLLSKKYEDLDYEAQALNTKGGIFYHFGNYDSALFYYHQALLKCKREKQPEVYVKILNNIANILALTQKIDTAIYLYNKVLKYYESTNNSIKVGKILYNIGCLYDHANNREKSHEYTLKALEILKRSGDREGTMLALLSLAIDAEYYNINHEEALKYTEQVIELSINCNEMVYAKALLVSSACYAEQNNMSKAVSAINKAIEIYKKNNSRNGLIEGYRSMAECLIVMKQYKKAKEYSLLTLKLTDTTNIPELQMIYSVLKQVYIFLNEPKKAIYYSDKEIELLKQGLTEDWHEKIANAEASYQTEKKEKEIFKLQKEKQINELSIKRKNLLIYALFITLSLLMSLAFLFYRYTHNKRIIAEQDNQLKQHKIRELENEKILLATQSVLQGEEKERKRIANDLHDGLGGLLSGTKIAFTNMKNNVVLPDESVNVFNHALGMLESSITELRRVAHSMMPEALLNFGLKNALNDFCRGLDKSNPTHITFQFYGQFERVDSNLEINAYRIIQELVHNALKHASAKELVVQMLQEPDRLSFTVQDNGKGFDVKSLDTQKGLGLASVRSRMDFFKGRMEINSKSSVGTEITIEFQL
jgi:two-component system, NarL family, sensor kinase